MARMIPSGPKTNSPRSERDIFRQLRDQLPDSWMVFQACSYVLPNSKGEKFTEGEADFIVFDPSRGFIVIEVKGGLVLLENGSFYSIDKGGLHHKIKDPSNQAGNAAYSINRLLRGHPNLRSASIGSAGPLPSLIVKYHIRWGRDYHAI